MTLFQMMKKHGLDHISGGTATANYQGIFPFLIETALLLTINTILVAWPNDSLPKNRHH
jgi:hypothetical protein